MRTGSQRAPFYPCRTNTVSGTRLTFPVTVVLYCRVRLRLLEEELDGANSKGLSQAFDGVVARIGVTAGFEIADGGLVQTGRFSQLGLRHLATFPGGPHRVFLHRGRNIPVWAKSCQDYFHRNGIIFTVSCKVLACK